MGRLPALRPEVVIAVLLVLAVGSAAAQDQVTRLRMNKVTLYPCTDTDERTITVGQDPPKFAQEQLEVTRTEPQAPWPILAGPSKAGRLTVKVGAELYCVRAYAVETSKPIHTEADCGTMVAAAQPRSGATRGLGEKCRDKQK